MSQADGTLAERLRLSRDGGDNILAVREVERSEILFEAIHHLEVAFQKMGFSHGDIKTTNLVYVYSRERRNYRDYDLTLENAIYPLWIDFGLSSTGSSDVDQDTRAQLRELIKEFQFSSRLEESLLLNFSVEQQSTDKNESIYVRLLTTLRLAITRLSDM
jgi:hypothetical protein